jgi:predicted alpha/beta hydrolase family esterase
MARYLILPGLGNSGPQHWQSFWEASSTDFLRVEQRDWDNPKRADWIMAIAAAVRANPGAVLIAHSLACSAIAHTLAEHPDLPISAALLVAPADVDSPYHTPDEVRSFAPMPMARLPFPALVVASQTDDYVSLKRARAFADAWCAQFVNIGPHGHINSASGLGDWPQGKELLSRLVDGEKRPVPATNVDLQQSVLDGFGWRDSTIESLVVGADSVAVEVTLAKRRVRLECLGYIGYQAVGMWDFDLVETVKISLDSPFLKACIASINGRYPGEFQDTDSSYRSRKTFFSVIITCIDGVEIEIIQNDLALTELASIPMSMMSNGD